MQAALFYFKKILEKLDVPVPSQMDIARGCEYYIDVTNHHRFFNDIFKPKLCDIGINNDTLIQIAEKIGAKNYEIGTHVSCPELPRDKIVEFWKEVYKEVLKKHDKS